MKPFELSPGGLQLLLDGEVGGGRAYYDRFCRHPIVPDPEHTSSGVTIGIGWDCGAHTPAELESAWGPYLNDTIIALLSRACGLRGMAAKNARLNLGIKAIYIPWEKALAQFEEQTVPAYWAQTVSAFNLPVDSPRCVREALLSLVVNRGAGMQGDARREMREIRELVAGRQWNGIPDRLRSMKRLWPNTRGLQRRREAEAAHIERGLASAANQPGQDIEGAGR